MATVDFTAVLSSFYTPSQLKTIRGIHVGIAGAGGLGSNTAVNLVRSGFEKFTVVDFDVVEPSNLNRQYYFADQIGKSKVDALRDVLRKINPAVSYRSYALRLDEQSLPQVFGACDVIVEAVDSSSCKATIARAFSRSGKLLVCASGLGGYGASDRIRTRKIHDRFFVVGDETTEVDGCIKPYAPCVSIAAAKQADVVLSWVLGRCDKRPGDAEETNRCGPDSGS